MAVHPKIEVLDKYLDNPKQNKIPNLQQDGTSSFFLSFMGQLFIQGYRIFEKVGSNTLIVSLMQYQPYLSPSFQASKGNMLSQYKIVHFVVDVISEKSKRTQIFKYLKDIAQVIDGSVQVNILYLKNQKYSTMNIDQLQATRQPDSHHFFRHFGFLPEKKGYKHISAEEQGIRLHGLVEYLIKGNGYIRNTSAFKRAVIGDSAQIKFSYKLDKAINTLRFIIGKQVIENDYLIMSSEKWMRKKTEKIYKRFDLLLRNENKICIIDWKFSKVKAKEKINTKVFVRKNELYFQLAKKDYRSDVQLRFYCIHVEESLDYYHKYTQAQYQYKVEEVLLDSMIQQRAGEYGSDNQNDEIVFYDQGPPTNPVNGFVQVADRSASGTNVHIQEFRRRHGLVEHTRLQASVQNDNPVINQSIDGEIVQSQQQSKGNGLNAEGAGVNLDENAQEQAQSPKRHSPQSQNPTIIKSCQGENRQLRKIIKPNENKSICKYSENQLKQIQISSQITPLDSSGSLESVSFQLLENHVMQDMEVKYKDHKQFQQTRRGDRTNPERQHQAIKDNRDDCEVLQVFQIYSQEHSVSKNPQKSCEKPLFFDPKQIQPNRQSKHLITIGVKNNTNVNSDFRMSEERQSSIQYDKIDFDIYQRDGSKCNAGQNDGQGGDLAVVQASRLPLFQMQDYQETNNNVNRQTGSEKNQKQDQTVQISPQNKPNQKKSQKEQISPQKKFNPTKTVKITSQELIQIIHQQINPYKSKKVCNKKVKNINISSQRKKHKINHISYIVILSSQEQV